MEGMLTLRMDAWLKVMKGLTTTEQMDSRDVSLAECWARCRVQRMERVPHSESEWGSNLRDHSIPCGSCFSHLRPAPDTAFRRTTSSQKSFGRLR